MRFWFITVLTTLSLLSSVKAAPAYMSPEHLVAASNGQVAYTAATTGKAIIVFNMATDTVQTTISLPDDPTGIAISKDDSTLFVTAGVVKGKLLVIDAKTGNVTKTIPVGHNPVAPVVTADMKTVYLANRFANHVIKVDLAQGRIVASVKAVREPIALALNPTETSLFVANHLPAGRANGDRIAAAVSVIDTKSFTGKKTIELANGTISLRSLSLSPDGKWLYAPSYIARFSVPTTQLERGWMNTAALSIIDVEKESLYHALLLDDVDQGAANPWQVTTTPDSATLCVTHSSVHEVSVIDRKGLFNKLATLKPANEYKQMADYESLADSPVNRLDMMVGIRRRIQVNGNAPRGLVATNGKLITANYYSDDLSTITLAQQPKVTVVPVQKRQRLTVERQGATYFNDATVCFQKWQACASCHPDARADAVNWDLLNDGIGNPKNTKSMLLSHRTAPVMITGIRPNAETAVRAGIRYIQFTTVDEDRASAIDTYLKSLKPVPSPYLVNGKLSESAKRGRKIFDDVGCATCHNGDFFTDQKQYDVGTAVDGMDKGKAFDTPTLVEVWRTAPYLFDGRAATLEEVFTTFNKGDNHGFTSTLSKQELKDLIEYVNSL